MIEIDNEEKKKAFFLLKRSSFNSTLLLATHQFSQTDSRVHFGAVQKNRNIVYETLDSRKTSDKCTKNIGDDFNLDGAIYVGTCVGINSTN